MTAKPVQINKHISFVQSYDYNIDSSYLLQGMIQRKVYSNNDHERFTIIVNFMTTGAGVLVLGRGRIFHIVKMQHFFKNLLLYSQV